MRYVADFDSASAMLRALSASLRGRTFDRLGQPRLMDALLRVGNRLPERFRRVAYSWGGWSEAIPPKDLDEVSWERFGQWVIDQYPPAGSSNAAFVGASNGAAAHLAAALNATWLPQTFMVPVRRHGDPDDARSALRFGRQHAPSLLDRERALQLHHMHDPNQDRLMVRHMTYFRFKGRRLSDPYRRFLRQALSPGAILFVIDCHAAWPVTRVDERHLFQHGAVGGLDPGEYHDGSARVARFLAEEGSSRRQWDPPPADELAPEAEWGFEPALLDDVIDVAEQAGHRVVRLSFEGPEALSLAVADVHRRWFARIGTPQQRLIAETFILVDPQRVLRHRAVPLWLTFPVEPSARTLSDHLDDNRYDEALITLFSHGLRSAGSVPVDTWERLVQRASYGATVGVDHDAYPADFATFTRYSSGLAQTTDDVPPPPALGAEELLGDLREVGPAHGVEVEEVAG